MAGPHGFEPSFGSKSCSFFMEKPIPDASLLDNAVLWLKFFLTGTTKNNDNFE